MTNVKYLISSSCYLEIHIDDPQYFIYIFSHESSTSFTNYYVQIMSTCLAWILQPLQFSLLPLI